MFGRSQNFRFSAPSAKVDLQINFNSKLNVIFYTVKSQFLRNRWDLIMVI
jgi:hypothetical protein